VEFPAAAFELQGEPRRFVDPADADERLDLVRVESEDPGLSNLSRLSERSRRSERGRRAFPLAQRQGELRERAPGVDREEKITEVLERGERLLGERPSVRG